MYRKDNQIFIKVEAYSGEHHMLRMLAGFLGICVLAYAYFVGVSIMNVIAHKEASTQSERINRTVSVLEQEYFKLSNTMTPDLGARVGLVPTSDTTYVRRPGAVGYASTGNVH